MNEISTTGRSPMSTSSSYTSSTAEKSYTGAPSTSR